MRVRITPSPPTPRFATMCNSIVGIRVGVRQAMARTAGRLTALKVGRLAEKPGMHADGGGLSCATSVMLNVRAGRDLFL